MNQLNNDIYKDVQHKLFDIGGWNAEHSVFADLVNQVKPKIIIEVGTWKGASAIQMANAVKHNNLSCTIYCIDTWLGSTEFWTTHADTKERDLMLINGYPSVYYQFLSNIVTLNLQDMIIPVPNTSANAAKILTFLEVKADLIYIDGSHEYDDVKADVTNYLKLLNPGGIMFGDDHGWPGVSTAVKEVLGNYSIIDLNYWIYRN